jgi:peptidoglycan/LPS O-acetylase OafA/YrhL
MIPTRLQRGLSFCRDPGCTAEFRPYTARMNLVAQTVAAEPAAHQHSFAHIRELDGLRGVAALMVFFHHVCFTSIPAGESIAWSLPVRLLWTLSIEGSYGVDLFFVLSGFLITSLLLEARARPAYYHDFYWKRALRILPLYLLCLLGVLLFVPGSRDFVLLSAFFLSNFAHALHVQGGGPFWTLAIEEQFYLLWPTVVRRRAVAALQRWALGIGVGTILLRLLAAVFGHRDYYFTFFHCDGLAWGSWLACWFSQHEAGKRNVRRTGLAITVALSAGIVLFAASQTSPDSLRALAFAACLRQTGVALFAAAILASLITHTGARSLDVLRSGVLPFFGLVSYAMYMLHLYVMEIYDGLRGAPRIGDDLAYALRFAAVLGGTLALCLLSRYAIELPAISLRRFLLARPAPRRPDDAPIPLGNM